MRVSGQDAVELRSVLITQIEGFFEAQDALGVPCENIMEAIHEAKIWLRKKELDVVCRAIEVTPPMGRLMIAYEFALQNVKHAKQALSNTIRVSKFVIWYWFNMGHLGKPIPVERFDAMMKEGQ